MVEAEPSNSAKWFLACAVHFGFTAGPNCALRCKKEARCGARTRNLMSDPMLFESQMPTD